MAEHGYRPAGKKYRPGETVPETAVYSVSHHRHRGEHEATLLGGETFPACARCGDAVRFRLAHQARPIKDDRDFD